MDNDRTQIEEIKSRLDIESVVERYLKLKKAGKNYLGLCPFHQEKTPSFTVSPSIQMFKCFGCGESGDVIKFIEKIEHLEFFEVLEKLAEETGVELKKRKQNSTYKKILEINDIATEIYAKELIKNIPAKKYLVKERLFNKESVDEFKIGYAPGGTVLLDNLKNKYSKKELLSTGLFTEKNNNIRDRFFKRIIFPIQNNKGNSVGFTGRGLPSENITPKYLHTPETELFKKGELLYGLYQAKTTIREKDLCIICEGTTDVISANQRGIKNVVAPLGTAVTEAQLKLISRNTKNLLLILDSDQAGQLALERYYTLGIPLGLNLWTSSPAPYKDLDDLMKEDSKKINDLIENKKDLFTHLILRKMKNIDLNNHKDYKEIIYYISNLLEYIKDDASKDFFINKAQQITTIDKKYFDVENNQPQEEEKKEKIQKNNVKLDDETYLLSIIIYFNDIEILKKIDTKFLMNKDVKDVIEYINEKNVLDEKKILKKYKENDTLKTAILESSGFGFDREKRDKYILNTYRTIKKKNIEKLIQKLKIKERIAIEENNDEKTDKITRDITRLKKILN